MDDKEAANILINLMDKYPFTAEEKDALKNAIGILSWTYLGKNRIKSIKSKKIIQD